MIVNGGWRMVDERWSMPQSSMADDHWSLIDHETWMSNGPWAVVDGERSMGQSPCSMVIGPCIMANG